MAPSADAAERVRRRIADWVTHEGRGSKKRLAGAVKSLYGKKKSQSWTTDVLDGPEKGGQDLRLKDLDDVAEAMGVAPGDLVRRDHDHYLEVTPTEMRLLTYVRAVPDVVRHHMMAYLDYIFSFQQRALDQQALERDRRTAAARGQQRRRKSV